MKTLCESWKDLAGLVINGAGIIHQLSEHLSDDCRGWQIGIRELCEWLDDANIEIDPEVYEKILENH